MPNPAPLAERAIAEVEALHAFFVRWLDAADPDPAMTPERFTGAAAAGFRLIAPSGGVLDRRTVVDWLAASRASRGTRERPFRIWTEDIRAEAIVPGVCLVTYVERQDVPDGPNARRSTAVMVEQEGAPNGVAWLHVHETHIGRE